MKFIQSQFLTLEKRESHIYYTHCCLECNKIHVCCEHCKQILPTIMKECPKCQTFCGQGVYSTDHPGSVGQNCEFLCECEETTFNSTCYSGIEVQASPGKESYVGRHLYHEGNTEPEDRGTTDVHDQNASYQRALAISNKNYRLSEGTNSLDHVSLGHPLDDPVFDHPEWSFLRDVIGVNESQANLPGQDPFQKDRPQNKQEKSSHIRGKLNEIKPERIASNSKPRNKNLSPKAEMGQRTDSIPERKNPTDEYKQTQSSFDSGRPQNCQSYQFIASDRPSNLREVMLQHGLIIKDVNPDGNCFFAAVVDQLRVRGTFFHTAKSLREAAVNYLREHPNQEDGTPLQEFLSDDCDSTWEGYLSNQARDGVWADHIVIQAISNVLQQRLVIHSFVQSNTAVNTTVVEPDITIQLDAKNADEYRDISCKTLERIKSKYESPPLSDNGFELDKTLNCENVSPRIKEALTEHYNESQQSDDQQTRLDNTTELVGRIADVCDAMTGLASKMEETHHTEDGQSHIRPSKSNERKTNKKTKIGISVDTQSNRSTINIQNQDENSTDRGLCDRSELKGTISNDDLVLGHIPEAHYFSLRSVDWPGKLCIEMSNTQQAFTSQEHGETLPTDHFDFLINYIKNGNFLESSEFWKYDHITLPPQLSQLYMCLGVGDRYNNLESYLTIDPITTQSSCFDEDGKLLIWYIVYPSDTLVSKLETLPEFKQLIPDETDCKLGYLKLKPKDPSIWKGSLKEENGNLFLKHLYLKQELKSKPGALKVVCFQCDWPEQALEARERLLKFRVRSKMESHHRIEEAVRVVPFCSHDTLCFKTDCTEWKYSFSILEYVICRKVMSKDARFCYKFIFHFLRYILNNCQMSSREITKTIFFYVCDELDIGNNQPTFIEIFSSFIQTFLKFLGTSFIPDFFFRSLNLIEGVSAEICKLHYERISDVNENHLVYIFLFLDKRGLMEHFGLSRCFDSLLYNVHYENCDTECFTSLAVMEAREWVMAPSLLNNFRKSSLPFNGINESGSHDVLADEPEYSNGVAVNLYKEVLGGIPLQEKWLYAFYLEYMSGKPFLDFVCENHECNSLRECFGESAVQILLADPHGRLRNQNIRLPIEITHQEGIASFAIQFVNCLKFQFFGQSVIDASITSVHFFLTQHTDVLLTNFTKNSDYQIDKLTELKKTISSLFILFNILYDLYNRQGRVHEIHNLLGVYERLCDFDPSVAGYEWLSRQWAYSGNTYKAQEAMMKANSFRSSSAVIYV